MAAGTQVKDSVRRVEDRNAASSAYEQDVYPAGEEAATEFSRHLFQAIWAARMAMLAVLVTSIVLGIGVLILYRMSRPLVTTYSTAISVTMPGAAERRYPNGMPFAVSDLQSPIVLETVFRNNGLDQYGVSLAAFAAMVSVSAESPALETANQRFRERLSRKDLTFEEQKSIEAEYAEEGQDAKGAPQSAEGAEDRRILFAAVARGLLAYLDAAGDDALSELSVKEASVDRTLTVTKTTWDISIA